MSDFLPQEDHFLMVEDELRGQIAMLLGGRSAEELIMSKVSTEPVMRSKKPTI
jgi:cell division protease FtsH